MTDDVAARSMLGEVEVHCPSTGAWFDANALESDARLEHVSVRLCDPEHCRAAAASWAGKLGSGGVWPSCPAALVRRRSVAMQDGQCDSLAAGVTLALCLRRGAVPVWIDTTVEAVSRFPHLPNGDCQVWASALPVYHFLVLGLTLHWLLACAVPVHSALARRRRQGDTGGGAGGPRLLARGRCSACTRTCRCVTRTAVPLCPPNPADNGPCCRPVGGPPLRRRGVPLLRVVRPTRGGPHGAPCGRLAAVVQPPADGGFSLLQCQPP
jgi:hypothetical protein